MTSMRGLYAVTDSQLIRPSQLASRVEAAIRGGVRLIQYRDKNLGNHTRQRQAATLLRICQSWGIRLIINDDVDLAHKLGADGVHLGKDDCAVERARKILGPHAIIGLSCYNSLERALEAEQAGASYVAFGRFFPSLTKPNAILANPGLLRMAKRQLHIPIVAIGGITVENGAQLIKAGADMLAVIHGIFGHEDCEGAARGLARLFASIDTCSSDP